MIDECPECQYPNGSTIYKGIYTPGKHCDLCDYIEPMHQEPTECSSGTGELLGIIASPQACTECKKVFDAGCLDVPPICPMCQDKKAAEKELQDGPRNNEIFTEVFDAFKTEGFHFKDDSSENICPRCKFKDESLGREYLPGFSCEKCSFLDIKYLARNCIADGIREARIKFQKTLMDKLRSSKKTIGKTGYVRRAK